MIYNVSHRTEYTYSAPVFLEPHILHLWPRNDASQKINGFSITVNPQPAGIHHFLDAEGNNATCFWFEGKTARLSITTSFEARMSCHNPFSYLVTDNAFFQLPVVYENFDAAALGPFLSTIDADDAVSAFGRKVFRNSNGNTLDFLSQLCMALYDNFKVEIHCLLPLPFKKKGEPAGTLFYCTCRYAVVSALQAAS